MTAEPLEVIRFTKSIDGRAVECRLERFDDGVLVSGEEIGDWIFEFTAEAYARALAAVAKEGYTRVTD